MNNVDAHSISCGVAVFCVVAICAAFLLGYGKCEWDIIRRGRRELKKEQAKLPRAK